ncbi:50S ribosomal protein L3 [Helicobacter cetorum]|uniref:50S ribosomal protein L3 n=1 Tax=Helicobacter cetorum (strain ATCC BAA-429 / MIT 00-7128) TaxID=182217 RepID=I0EKH3_HELC0|nr:50S ribosomal protein L3 [Helicobacter cetorum]AFI03442.1 50S ribosomal protein L3 [Helicobacter cetorum MIT 00-7128]
MEFLVQKIGMSRTVGADSIPVTLLKVLEAKVCQLENGKALVAYAMHKKYNKAIEGQQKKYQLSKEFNHFATLKASHQQELGDLDVSVLETLKKVKASFKTKGRGFAGAMKRWNFQGGPAAHGSRFHRRLGSIGNREWPGRVQKGKKMAGHYGNELVTGQNEVISFDKESMVLVLKGSVAGFSGAYGRIRAL